MDAANAAARGTRWKTTLVRIRKNADIAAKTIGGGPMTNGGAQKRKSAAFGKIMPTTKAKVQEVVVHRYRSEE